MDSSTFIDRCVLVTGASRGIGRAVAELFAAQGAQLVVSARSRSRIQSLIDSLTGRGYRAVARPADLAAPGEAAALVRFAARHWGRLDIVVNNAGILGPRVPLARYPLRQWKRVLDVNLGGTFCVAKQAVQVMSRQKSGCIINISSSVGRKGRAHWGAYAVAKFGIEGLTQVLGDEVKTDGVCVVSFNPGGTRTAMRARAYPGEDRSRLQDPMVPARAILRLAAHAVPDLSGCAFDLHNLP